MPGCWSPMRCLLIRSRLSHRSYRSSQSRKLWKNFGLFTSRLPDNIVTTSSAPRSKAVSQAGPCLPLQHHPGPPRASRAHIAVTRRVPVPFCASVLVHEASPLELSHRQDSPAPAGNLFHRARPAYLPPALTPSSAQASSGSLGFCSVSSVSAGLFATSAAAAPFCLSLLGHAARVGHPSKSFLLGMNRACLQWRPWSASDPGAAHQLVQHAALAAARCLVAGPLSRPNADIATRVRPETPTGRLV